MTEVEPAFVARLRDTAWLPQGPDDEAVDTLYRLRDLERHIVVSAGAYRPLGKIYKRDYVTGSAKQDNDIEVICRGQAPLVTAEHATDTIRSEDGQLDEADHGTGALALLLEERHKTSAIVTIGKQKVNLGANLDLPFWEEMRVLLPRSLGIASVHGMRPGKLLDRHDSTEIHAVIGLGHKNGSWQPNEQSRLIAEKLVAEAGDLGLRAVIGNDVFGRIKGYDSKTGGYVTDDDKQPKNSKLRAGGKGSTVNIAYDIMAAHHQSKPAMQLEMTRLLRLLPLDLEGGWHKDEKARAMGVHLGYLLAKKMVELIASCPAA